MKTVTSSNVGSEVTCICGCYGQRSGWLNLSFDGMGTEGGVCEAACIR